MNYLNDRNLRALSKTKVERMRLKWRSNRGIPKRNKIRRINLSSRRDGKWSLNTSLSNEM